MIGGGILLGMWGGNVDLELAYNLARWSSFFFSRSWGIGSTYGTIVRGNFDQSFENRFEPATGLTVCQGVGHAGGGAAGFHALPGARPGTGRRGVGLGDSGRGHLVVDHLLANKSLQTQPLREFWSQAVALEMTMG